MCRWWMEEKGRGEGREGGGETEGKRGRWRGGEEVENVLWASCLRNLALAAWPPGVLE